MKPHRSESSHLGTTILSVNMMSYVIAAIIFAPGPPYRRGFFSNKPYLAVVIFNIFLVILLVLYPPAFLMKWMNVVPLVLSQRRWAGSYDPSPPSSDRKSDPLPETTENPDRRLPPRDDRYGRDRYSDDRYDSRYDRTKYDDDTDRRRYRDDTYDDRYKDDRKMIAIGIMTPVVEEELIRNATMMTEDIAVVLEEVKRVTKIAIQMTTEIMIQDMTMTEEIETVIETMIEDHITEMNVLRMTEEDMTMRKMIKERTDIREMEAVPPANSPTKMPPISLPPRDKYEISDNIARRMDPAAAYDQEESRINPRNLKSSSPSSHEAY
ncbi:ATP13A3 [Cordylochernes scorpioides]|uniref:ATP13A3 n=1 Tax=Cordylochernes scorpioides TaxID=51811 RepID=A0ABY6LRM4_9ARAC|nr:ATP13A3 [Cordylochernes scorpioides]